MVLMERGGDWWGLIGRGGMTGEGRGHDEKKVGLCGFGEGGG